MRVGILTVSDRVYRKEREDLSGPLIKTLIEERLGGQIEVMEVIPDELLEIRNRLIAWSDELRLDLILTTGGTGFAPRDCTPEATVDILDRQAPGLAEAMRAASLRATPYGMLSRGVSGIRGRTLIINLPGNPKAVRENMETILPALPHALALLRGEPQAQAEHELA